jgi:8-oxo-dGTP pyrophosphatase MutT (NUDIX family)
MPTRKREMLHPPGLGFAPSYDAKFIKPKENILRQSAYFISVIPVDTFIKYGAKYIDWGVYYIHKEYDGSPTQETCALVGIPLLHVDQFYTESSELIQNLKHREEFQHIHGIEFITCANTCETLSKFKEYFDACDTSSLLLLNIEPKGFGKISVKYPDPRFTIPGGTMEDADCNDFEQCALREFIEETALPIQNKYVVVSYKRFVKEVKKHSKRRFGVNFFSKKSFDTIEHSIEDSKEISLEEEEEEEGDEDGKKEELKKRRNIFHTLHKRGKRKQKLVTVSMFFFITIA